MKSVVIIGCGFVADLYMRSLATFPDIRVAAAYDRSNDRLAAFCRHWEIASCATLADAIAAAPDKSTLFLNLTNPTSHYEVSRAILEAGYHVYSEKPLALDMRHAEELHRLARERGLLIASAPCSVLGEAAQTLGHALRHGVAGKPRLVYAELDDDFVSQAPYRSWISESGAPWPYADEFRTGCTLEHAGYYLTWLIAFFGSVRTVTAASAEVVPDKLGEGASAPDFAVAVLYFESGMVARLTCSIVAPHDHGLRIFCDAGVLGCDAAWSNTARITFRRRFNVRRRQVNHPFPRRLKLRRETHPKVGRTGAASMNFALGPAELLDAITTGRPPRLSADFALHLNEVTLAIQNAGSATGAQTMNTRCLPMEPMPWAQ